MSNHKKQGPDSNDTLDLRNSVKSRTGTFSVPKELLKFGSLKDTTECILSDHRTRVFVKAGHNVNKVVNNYEKHMERYRNNGQSIHADVNINPVPFSDNV